MQESGYYDKIKVAQIQIILYGIIDHKKATLVQSGLQPVQLCALSRATEAQEQILLLTVGQFNSMALGMTSSETQLAL
jgi:hypothetical protein